MVRIGSLYLSEVQVKALRAISKKMDRPVAELIRQAIDEWLFNHEPIRKIPRKLQSE